MMKKLKDPRYFCGAALF